MWIKMKTTKNLKNETFTILKGTDLLRARHSARKHAREIGLEADEVLKLETATSELTRNMLSYAGGGMVKVEQIASEKRKGIRITFQDDGPGIPDIRLALREGYTTNRGLGLGLPGARRLVDDFKIDSKIGRGTRIVIVKWMKS